MRKKELETEDDTLKRLEELELLESLEDDLIRYFLFITDFIFS